MKNVCILALIIWGTVAVLNMFPFDYRSIIIFGSCILIFLFILVIDELMRTSKITVFGG